MVKTLKNFLLQNQESFEAESWYIASGMQGLPTSDDNPRMTLTFFLRHCQISVPSCCRNKGRMLHGICRYAMVVLLR